MTVELIVPGRPAPKGSLRCVGGRGRPHQLIEQLADSQKEWRQVVTAAARHNLEPLARYAPVAVSVAFTLPRPASGKLTRPSGRVGDVDKLARLVLDALESAGALADDAQVVELHASKHYPAPGPQALPWPGARIRITAL